MKIIMTVDFEGHFSSKFHLENELNNILGLFRKFNVSATFFIIGELLDKYPDIFKKIPLNHELASHSYSHSNLKNKSIKFMKDEIKKSRLSVEKIRKKCYGFRSPYNLTNKNLIKILREEKFQYDSSLSRTYFPLRYNNRGIPNTPYKISKSFYEIPISSFSLLKVPFGLSFIKAFYPFYAPNNIPDFSTFYFHNYDLFPKKYNESFIVDFLMNRKKGQGIKLLKRYLSQHEFITCIDWIKHYS